MTPEQLAKSGTEDGHQAALFCKAAMEQARYPELRWLHAIPNGGQRNKVTAARMKTTGTRAGVLDIFLPVPINDATGRQFFGLYIEMKKPGFENRKNGGMSEKQVKFKQHAVFWGYAVVTCYSWLEAWEALESYLAEVPAETREKYRELVEVGMV